MSGKHLPHYKRKRNNSRVGIGYCTPEQGCPTGSSQDVCSLWEITCSCWALIWLMLPLLLWLLLQSDSQGSPPIPASTSSPTPGGRAAQHGVAHMQPRAPLCHRGAHRVVNVRRGVTMHPMGKCLPTCIVQCSRVEECLLMCICEVCSLGRSVLLLMPPWWYVIHAGVAHGAYGSSPHWS